MPYKDPEKQRDLMRKRRAAQSGSESLATPPAPPSEPLPGQTMLDGFGTDIPAGIGGKFCQKCPEHMAHLEGHIVCGFNENFPYPRRLKEQAPELADPEPKPDQLPQDSESSLPDMGELVPGQKTEFRIVRIIEDPADIVYESTKRLKEQGWVVWTCSILDGEKIVIVRDEWVRDYPQGMPVYTEAELIRVCELPPARISFINEAKEFNPGTKYIETILKGVK